MVVEVPAEEEVVGEIEEAEKPVKKKMSKKQRKKLEKEERVS